jgi:hypothetical protein
MAGTINPSFFNSQALWHRQNNPLPPGKSGLPTTPGAARPVPPADTFSASTPSSGAEDLSVLQRQMTQISLSAQVQQSSLRLQQGQDGATAEASQLSFDFMAEMRSEELFRFAQRTGAAAEGMDDETSASFMEMSRRMAARFQFSFTMSSVALNGFAGAAEQLQEAGESPEGLVDFTGGALEKADELLNRAFEVIADFLTGEIDDVGARLNEIFSDLGTMFQPEQTEQPDGTDSGTLATASQFSFSFQFEFSFMQEQTVVQEADPLVLDLNGNGIELTDHAEGALFDIAGLGEMVRTAFVRGGDAFLALDRDANGAIDSGRELFGDQLGAANGYEELRRLDTNGDGAITADDRAFNSLLLFRDNGNGRTEPGELQSLREAGIAEISLRYQQVNVQISGNRLTEIGSYRREDGSEGLAGDARLRFRA